MKRICFDTKKTSKSLIISNYYISSSFGLPHDRLLCVVRLEVFQEKAPQGQKEGKGWEGEGETIRKIFFFFNFSF